MKKGKVFQEDFFELDPAALQNDIFIRQAARSNSYKPLDNQIQSNLFVSIYFCQHDEDLHHADAVKQKAIYLRPREKDPQFNDKNLHDFRWCGCVF